MYLRTLLFYFLNIFKPSVLISWRFRWEILKSNTFRADSLAWVSALHFNVNSSNILLTLYEK